MSSRKDILFELSTISQVVAELPFAPVFTVPEGYFTAFPEKMLKKIRESEDSDVKSELEVLSPLLASLNRKTPFAVPEGYFSELETKILAENEQVPAKLVKMYKPGKLRILYAAAAVTAMLGFFTWFYIINNNNTTSSVTATLNINSELPKLSEMEISSYLAATPENLLTEPLSLAGIGEADIDEIMNEINEAELQQYINETPVLQIENMN